VKPVENEPWPRQTAATPLDEAVARYAAQGHGAPRGRRLSPHLRRLEAEAIGIFRETVAQCRKPVLLYSIGKDSTVLMHLARKAFFPAPPPFPFLHIATGWDFADMIALRDLMAKALGFELIVHTNAEGLARGINPITSGPTVHMRVMATEALKQALAQGGFDAAFGGARRDEEKARAKERIFSIRSAEQGWDPRRQRPELWTLYNARLNPGESVRVFPLSNWTEMDVWSYIAAEDIPVVPLYFAARRPIVRVDGQVILMDDDRFLSLRPDLADRVETASVRFRTLGCYPLTAGTESLARDVDEVIAEVAASRWSERQGRLIDRDEAASMERKKREGYF
jgi:sulfate adenylyltransferase subunit 2